MWGLELPPGLRPWIDPEPLEDLDVPPTLNRLQFLTTPLRQVTCSRGVPGCLHDMRKPDYEEADAFHQRHHSGCWCVYCQAVELQQERWDGMD